jgi:hypothetical protein
MYATWQHDLLKSNDVEVLSAFEKEYFSASIYRRIAQNSPLSLLILKTQARFSNLNLTKSGLEVAFCTVVWLTKEFTVFTRG